MRCRCNACRNDKGYCSVMGPYSPPPFSCPGPGCNGAFYRPKHHKIKEKFESLGNPDKIFFFECMTCHREIWLNREGVFSCED